MNEVKNTAMPERLYLIDSNMSFDKIVQAKENGNFLVGKITKWNAQSQVLEVDLGNDFIGLMPINEASIYPSIDSNGHLLPSIYSTFGHNICVSVTDITDKIMLSRKKNMLKGFEIISNSFGKIFKCYITSVTKYALFLDVGFGICGMIHVKELTNCRLEDISLLGFNKGEIIYAKMLSVDENFHVDLNHKDLFPNLVNCLTPGDLITVISLSPVNEEKNGYFAYIDPGNAAIINPSPGEELPYGSKIVAVVRNPSKKGNNIRLKFLHFI